MMDVLSILQNQDMKPLEKRARLAGALMKGGLLQEDISAAASGLNLRQATLVLEALEEATRRRPDIASHETLAFALPYLSSSQDSQKREAARVIGNIAHLFPGGLQPAIALLLENARHPGTVVRWSSAYALARIITLPQHAGTGLFDTLEAICDAEENSGVKNQYVKALKKARQGKV